MRTYGTPLAAATFAFVAIASRAIAAGPPAVELDGCVRPSEACSDKIRDVVQIDDGKRKLPFAVETVRLPLNPRASTGKLLTELKLRGLRVHGPDEIVQKIVPGAHVRVRGTLFTGPRMLLQGVDPLGEKKH